MSYEYKTILKTKEYDFDLHKNRWNSRLSYVSAISKEVYGYSSKLIAVAVINNKTGVFEIFDEAKEKFSKKTISNIEKKIKLIHNLS